MIIGIPKEIKNQEYRVGATPALVNTLVQAGHTVLVESGAGEGVDFSDEMYIRGGAFVVASAKEVWTADMIVKVKEPQKGEFSFMRPHQILFCFLHLAPNKEDTLVLKEKEITGIAFETIHTPEGVLPILAPMSEIAGCLSVQIGAQFLQKNEGGKGVLLGGIPGVSRGHVVIVGGGIAGAGAAKIAIGLGAKVTVLDRQLKKLQQLERHYGSSISTIFASPSSFEALIPSADLLIGSIHNRGQKASKVILKKMIAQMEKGSVFIDISIDQGGCSETSKVTSHDDPVYQVDGVTHYCVPNMPSLAAKTATEALANATSSYILELANKGVKKALKENSELLAGLNLYQGKITNEEVAYAQKESYVDPLSLLNSEER